MHVTEIFEVATLPVGLRWECTCGESGLTIDARASLEHHYQAILLHWWLDCPCYAHNDCNCACEDPNV